MSEQTRPDPRERPSDPAGTQPKFDPRSLEPSPQEDQLALTAGEPAFAETEMASPETDTPCAETEPSETRQYTTAEPARAGSEQPLTPAPPRAAAPPARVTPPTRPPGDHPHAPRFQFLYGVLGALLLCAVGLTIVLLSAPASHPGPPWSAWRPADDGVDPAQQIADYIAPQYQLDNGKQIVAVTGGPPVLAGAPLTVGILSSGESPKRLEGNIVLYQLCGGGASCSIAEGKPSQERALLLGREALELALYTFRYVGGVDQVVVTIPPPPTASTSHAKSAGTATTIANSPAVDSTSATSTHTSALPINHAMLFRAQDLAAEVGSPVSATLSPLTPRVSQMNRSPDAQAVKELTDPRIYDMTVSDSQQEGPIMLLEPPGVGG